MKRWGEAVASSNTQVPAEECKTYKSAQKHEPVRRTKQLPEADLQETGTYEQPDKEFGMPVANVFDKLKGDTGEELNDSKYKPRVCVNTSGRLTHFLVSKHTLQDYGFLKGMKSENRPRE